jgi:hypothetical protein
MWKVNNSLRVFAIVSVEFLRGERVAGMVKTLRHLGTVG